MTRDAEYPEQRNPRTLSEKGERRKERKERKEERKEKKKHTTTTTISCGACNYHRIVWCMHTYACHSHTMTSGGLRAGGMVGQCRV